MGKCLFMRKGETHSAPLTGIKASELSVGSSVYLNENGSPVEYLIVNQGIPSNSSLYDSSCNGTWLLRKDIYENRQWHSSNSNSYKVSTIHSYLNSTFLGLFDAVTQAIIKQAKIPHCNGAGSSAIVSGSSGLSTKIFLLGGYEVGWTTSTNSTLAIDGAILSYFKEAETVSMHSKRVARLNGVANSWWTRSPRTNNEQVAVYAMLNGSFNSGNCSESLGIRPALIIPSNALFDPNTLVLKGVA